MAASLARILARVDEVHRSLYQFEYRDVGRRADRERTELVHYRDEHRRSRGGHGDDLLEREPQVEELAHHPGQVRYPGGVAADRVDVAADRVGRETLRDRGFRHGVVEAAAAVADVDQDAALLRGERRGEDLAVAHGVVAGARVGVGEDVAGTKQIQQRRELARRVADVTHDARAAHAGALAGEDRPLERLETVRADPVDRLAHPDAEHALGLFRERLRRLVDVGVIDVEHLADRKPPKADQGYVHEGVDAGARLRDDVVLQRRERVRARVARAYIGRGRRVEHELVGGQA